MIKNILLFNSILLLMSFAKPENTYTLIVFEGSDWCSVCRKFEKEILKNSTVITYLQENNIKVKRIDFPQRKKMSKEQKEANKKYAEKYNFKGLFPTIVFTYSKKEKYYTLTSTKIKPRDFIKWLENKIHLNQ